MLGDAVMNVLDEFLCSVIVAVVGVSDDNIGTRDLAGEGRIVDANDGAVIHFWVA